MARTPFRFVTPDTRLRHIQFARDREEERKGRLDEMDARRKMQIDQEMQRETQRSAELDQRDSIGQQMQVEQQRKADLDRREPRGLGREGRREMGMPPGPAASGARQPTPTLFDEGVARFREVEQRQQPPAPTARRVYPSGEMGPKLTPGFAEAEAFVGGAKFTPEGGTRGFQEFYEAYKANLDTRLAGLERTNQRRALDDLPPLTEEDADLAARQFAQRQLEMRGAVQRGWGTALEAVDYPRQMVKEHIIEPVVPEFDLAIPKEVFWATGRPQKEDVTITSGMVEEAASWILDPLNLLPVVGWGPDLLRAAKAARRGTPAALKGLLKKPEVRNFLKTVTSEAGGPKVPGVGPEDVARVTPETMPPPSRRASEPHIAHADPSGPPPRKPPPAKPRGPSPDEPEFRRIQDLALKGEKPEVTLIRRHEGAINTARREAQIEVEEGNRLLRQAEIGQSYKGTVVARATQPDEFDDLYRFLHNPSRVESGELVVPPKLRPTYDRLRQLTDWEEVARLDFDPKMATVDDYFYRGWKPPEEMFTGPPTRGALGRTPGFKLPRVNATYDEMRAAGFEPLHWNPFEQWRYSRMMGVRYREQMRLVEDIKELGLAAVHTGGPIPEGWRVPRVGSAFEGKPFAIVDEAGGARPMFTRRWIVPDTMADRLENIYGVAPQLGTVEVAGRAINLAKAVDAVVFIPKRAKLVASVFQHVDFLTRSHLGAWTGMVNALRHGKPVSAVKHLAVWPNSARKILQATVSPGYRQNLRHMALDTAPLVPERPGLTMKAVSEAGLSLQDVTILPANIDKIAREVAQEAVAAKAIKSPATALAGFERVHRQGLFQGVYPAAILTDVKNNIVPIMVRNYPNLTDAQLAGQIAKAASTKYSTIPASMSAVQNRTLRGVLTRTFFSMGETEGLLRQATGALRGPQAAYWRDHWLGVYIGLIATANAIHFVSTGEPLPFARYSPVSRNKWGPLPIGYNRDFAAPNIPLTGRSGTELTLDLVGQLDTAFRILDPAGFIGARESVPIRTITNQIKGTDFFGAPIDEVGPQGIISRTSQLIFDMFAPIGVGQAGLELARSNIEGAEGIIRPGEDRLGTAGTAVQATGVNLRAETTPQLLDRIRGDVMREKGIGGRYEDIKATDSPLANEIDDEVEVRIGQELEMRRETAELRGQTTPQSQGFEATEATRETQQTEQLADDAKLNTGQWQGDVWREGYRERQRDFFNRREQIKQDFQIEFADKEAPSGSVNAAIAAYFDVNVDDYAQPDGETDWDGFFKARDAALKGLSSSDRPRVMKFIRKYDTPTVKEFRKAQDVVDKVFETPKYVGLSLEEGEEVDRILFEIVPRMQTAQLRQGVELERGTAVMAAVSFVKDPDVAKFLLTNFGPRLSVRQRRRKRAGRAVSLEAASVVNPERDDILLENQDILALFYPDLLARQLSREQEAGLGEQAFAATQS